jgi:glutathione peroxidase
MKDNFFDYTVKAANMSDYNLDQHKGKVVLVVNVASRCGFTPQYTGLEALYESFPNDKFVVLGFPCNQFGAQEPGSNQEIIDFCDMTYKIKFPVLSKVNVNGSETEPVYEYLKTSAPGLLGTEAIKWNFTKFLVGKDGKVIERYAPNTEPMTIKGDVEKALQA